MLSTQNVRLSGWSRGRQYREFVVGCSGQSTLSPIYAFQHTPRTQRGQSISRGRPQKARFEEYRQTAVAGLFIFSLRLLLIPEIFLRTVNRKSVTGNRF